MSKTLSAHEFSKAVIDCSKKYVEKETIEATVLLEEAKKQKIEIPEQYLWWTDGICTYLVPLLQTAENDIETYKNDLASLLQIAKQQSLIIPRKYLWWSKGICTYLISAMNIWRTENTVEEYKQEVGALFQTARVQNLRISQEQIWWLNGIGAYLVSLPSVQQTPYIRQLRDVLYTLLKGDFADIIVEEVITPKKFAPALTIKTPQLPPKSTAQKPARIKKTPHPKKRKTGTVTPKSPVKVLSETPIATTELTDELRTALHEIVFENTDRSKVTLNFQITPHKERYINTWNSCLQYLGHISSIPENIQQVKREIEERIKKSNTGHAGVFRNAEINNYLYNRVTTILTYLKEAFPLEKVE